MVHFPHERLHLLPSPSLYERLDPENVYPIAYDSTFKQFQSCILYLLNLKESKRARPTSFLEPAPSC